MTTTADLARAKIAALRKAPISGIPAEVRLAFRDEPALEPPREKTPAELAARAAENAATIERGRQAARDAYARHVARAIDRSAT